MTTNRMMENANKIAFIVQQYPEHKLPDVISLLAMPSIEINTGIWLAIELGYFKEPDPETGEIEFLKAPIKWQFGDAQDTLQKMLIYSFGQLAKKETDLEENYLSNWTAGYSPHDVLIAIRQLLNEDVIAEYHIEDDGGTYTFYTLKGNEEHLWGRKQFKKDPLAGMKKKEK